MRNSLFTGRLRALRLMAVSAILISLLVPAAFAAAEDDYESFGRRAVNFLIDGNGRGFSRSIDQKALLDSVFEGISGNDKAVKDLRQGLSIGLDQVGDVLVRNTENAQMKYLRSRVKDDRHTALMRIDFRDKGINYLDFVLQKDEDGDIKIVDWYDYSKGQYYTDSIRQAIVLLLPEDETFLEKILGTGGINSKEVDQFIKLGSLVQEQKYAEWLELYKELPPELRDSRILMLNRILIASASGDAATYRIALKQLNDKMGDDPTLSLILIDYYFFEEDYDSALQALDRLAEYIGGDAAIDTLKANTYFAAKNYSQSIKYANKAISTDDEYEDSYWTLFNASLAAKKYETSVDALEMLADRFGYEISPENIEGAEEYNDFTKSEAYKNWKEEQTAEGE